MTTEPVGNDQVMLTRFADLRKQHPLACGDADLVMIIFLLITKRARHPAAAGIGLPMLKTHLVEDLFFREQDAEFFVVKLFQRLLLTVSMDQSLSFQLRNEILRCLRTQKIAQREA